MFCNLPGRASGIFIIFPEDDSSIVRRYLFNDLVIKIRSDGAADAKLSAHLVEQSLVYGGSRLMPFLHHVKERSRHLHIASLRCEALSLLKGTAEHIIPRLHLIHVDPMASLGERRSQPWRDWQVIHHAIVQAVWKGGFVAALIALAQLL